MGDILLHVPRDDVYGDPGVHAISVNYFENLKSSPQAHRICMDMLTSGSPVDDRAKSICLTVIAEYIIDQYVDDSPDNDQEEIKNFLARYAELQLGSRNCARLEEQPVRNIVADIYCRMCLVDYPHRWPGFFDSLVLTVGMGSKAVDNYLRTLSFISCSVSGTAYSNDVFERNEAIKEAVQADDIGKILDSWCVILSKYSDTIKVECLRVINDYLTWVNPIHFVGHPIIPILSREMDCEETQNHVLDCFYELVKNMSMNHSTSIGFVEEIFHHVILARNLTVPNLEKEALSIRIGELMSAIGINLLGIYDHQFILNNTEKYPLNFVNIFPYVINYLECKNTNISSSAIACVGNFVNFLQSRDKLTREEYNNYRKLLATVLRRMKINPTYDFDVNKNKEDAFTQYRNTLVLVFEDLVAVKKKVVFKGVNQVILRYFIEKDWSKEPFHLAEYPVFLLNLLAGVTCYETDLVQVKMIKNMIKALLTCGIMSHPHPLVIMQLFRAISINNAFFKGEQSFTSKVLTYFFEKGINNSSSRMKTLSAKHLLRFVKVLRSDLTNSYPYIISSIHKATIVHNAFIEQPRFEKMNREAQLHLFEVTSIAIAEGTFATQNKRHYMAEVIVPAMHMYHNHSHGWTKSRDQSDSAEGICQAVDIVAHLTRGFDADTASRSGCDAVFIDTLTILDHCPMAQMIRSDIHGAMMRLIRQMIGCLDVKFIPFASPMLRGLLYCRDTENVKEFSKVVTIAIKKYKNLLIHFFRRDFQRIGSYIFDSFTRASLMLATRKHNKAELDDRQECYLRIVTELVNTGMFIEIFEAHSDKAMARIVSMITLSALGGSDREWRMKGFSVLKHLVEEWDPIGGVSSEAIYFIYNFIVRGCFLALKEAIKTINNSYVDYVDMFRQCAQLLQKMYEKRGDELLAWLAEEFLPELKVPPLLIDELIEVFVGDPFLSFEEYLKSFYFETADDLEFPPLPSITPMMY